MEVIDNFWETLRSGQVLHLGWWSYLLLIILVAVEGPFATMFGAAAAAAGFLELPLVFVSSAAGNILADSLWYLVGRAGKVEWLLHYSHWLRVRRSDIERVKQDVQAHSPRFLLMAKLTNVLVVPVLITAGLARVPWRRWVPYVTLGTLIVTGALTLIGYYSTQAAKQIGQGFEFVALASPIVFVLVSMGLVRRWLRRRDEPRGSAQTSEVSETSEV